MTFVPLASYRAFEPLVRFIVADGNYPMNQQVQNRTDLQKAPSIDGARFDEVCDWNSGLGVGPVARRDWAPGYGVEIERYVGDIHVADLVACDGDEIVRPSFSFRCPTCFVQDWYHVSEFSEVYTCRYCFNVQRVDFASTRDWQYKADGLFRIPDSAQGSVAVILSLWRLDHFARNHHARFLTSQNVRVRDTGSRCEVDYVYVCMGTFDTSYDVVLGQAMRFGDFKDADMKNMADLADRFPRRPCLAFSTLKDRYSDADRARLRGLAGRGYRVIALTREELDPYDLFARFEAAPNKYAVTLAELSENTLHLNVGSEASPSDDN